MLSSMRGLRGRPGTVAVLAVAAVLVLGLTTAVVVALTTHRPPPAVAVGAHRGSPGAVAAGHAVPATDATPAPSPTSGAKAARSVRIDERSGPVTVPVGGQIDVELTGDATDRWSEPSTPTPDVLDRVSGGATPDGNARALFQAVAAGHGFILLERSGGCSSGPNGGVCGVSAHRISVTVTR